MERILKDARLELTNIQSERLIKELMMYRKKQLFSTGLSNAKKSGDILSIIKIREHLDDYLPYSANVQENYK